MLFSTCGRRTQHQKILLFLSQRASKPISTSPALTHQDISDLILQQKSASQVLETFQWASKIPFFHHDRTTYRALLCALVNFRRFDDARKVLQEIPSATGSLPDDDSFVVLIRGLGRAGMAGEAIEVLSFMSSCFGVKSPSLKVLNSVLNVLVQDDIDVARAFYRKRMASRGVPSDDHTFGILMKGLCRTNRIAEAFKLLKLVKSSGMGANPVICNTLLHALCRNGKIGRARSLMSEMESPSDVTFNIMISAYCGEGDVVKAQVMLEKSFDLGFVPDAISVTKLVDLLGNKGRVMEAVELIERVEQKGGEAAVDVVCYNALIRGFSSIGKPKAGMRVLKEMERKGRLPDVRTYNALITGYCAAGDLDSAGDIFIEMSTAGVAADFTTFDMMIRGFCSCGKVAEGLRYLDMMEQQSGGEVNKIEPYNSVIYGFYRHDKPGEAYGFLGRTRWAFPKAFKQSLMVLKYCELGRTFEALKVFDEMTKEGRIPSVLVYDRLVDALCRENDVRKAFDVMNEMVVRSGHRPVLSMFNALLAGCCGGGEVGSACMLLGEMAERGGCSPDAVSYGVVIDACCRGGKLQKACAVLAEMVGNGLLPCCSVWNSLVVGVIADLTRVGMLDGIVQSNLLHPCVGRETKDFRGEGGCLQGMLEGKDESFV